MSILFDLLSPSLVIPLVSTTFSTKGEPTSLGLEALQFLLNITTVLPLIWALLALTE